MFVAHQSRKKLFPASDDAPAPLQICTIQKSGIAARLYAETLKKRDCEVSTLKHTVATLDERMREQTYNSTKLAAMCERMYLKNKALNEHNERLRQAEKEQRRRALQLERKLSATYEEAQRTSEQLARQDAERAKKATAAATKLERRYIAQLLYGV